MPVSGSNIPPCAAQAASISRGSGLGGLGSLGGLGGLGSSVTAFSSKHHTGGTPAGNAIPALADPAGHTCGGGGGGIGVMPAVFPAGYTGVFEGLGVVGVGVGLKVPSPVGPPACLNKGLRSTFILKP